MVGGPRTGKSHALVAVAAARISAGADLESALLLAGSPRAAAAGSEVRSPWPCSVGAIDGFGRRAVIREPLVRTIHSHAFAVLNARFACR